MKNRFLILIAFIFSTAIFTGCEKDDPEIEKTAVQPMAGEWFVKYELKDASGNYEDISGYTRVITTSTSDNTDNQMYIGDVFINPREVDTRAAATSGEFWTYMVKANVNLGDMTFNADDKSIIVEKARPAVGTTPARPATPYDINVKITEGRIIKDGSVPPSGTTTDSIVFMVEFEDDAPGTVYRASGYRRTGFLEDEH
jgi:hypothetical protein